MSHIRVYLDITASSPFQKKPRLLTFFPVFQIAVGGLFYAILLQRHVHDGGTQKEDKRAAPGVSAAAQPQPVDRHIRVAPRHHRGRGALRVVQSFRTESVRPAEVQEFRVNCS